MGKVHIDLTSHILCMLLLLVTDAYKVQQDIGA